jgi:IS5 family transposase
MSWKNLTQKSLTDALISHHSAIEELDAVHDIINWKQIQKPLSSLYQGTRGAPSYPPLMLFKILILQAWYGLSDPAMEKQLARDLMFRRFIDLSLSEAVPDHSTIWRFRQLLQEQQLLTPLLELINNQLEQASLIITQGSISIIDATIIEAKNSRPKKNKQGISSQDKEAAYTRKAGSDGHQKTTYGYKLHANTDEDGFIKTLEYTPANIHDSQVFDELLTGDEEQVYADSAYASKKNDELLGDKNQILERAYRNKPLTNKQKRNNQQKSKIRSTVERVFGLMKLHQGLGKARYMGLARNKTGAQLLAMSHNIKCGLSLFKQMQKLKDSYA